MLVEALAEAGAMVLVVALFGVVFTQHSRWPWVGLVLLGLLAIVIAAFGGAA